MSTAEQNAARLAMRPLPPTIYVGDLRVRVVSLRSDGPDLVAELDATRDGRPAELDNPFIFRNPPIRVPDGGGGYREDLDAAIVEMVAEAVRVVTETM